MSARGNKVIISTSPQGKFLDVVLNGALLPGSILSLQSAFYQGGLHRYRNWAHATGGAFPVAVLLEKEYAGGGISTAYVSGDVGKVYFPVMGEELNVIKKDESGTGDDVSVGSQLIVQQTTGGLILTTGTPDRIPFMSLVALTDPTADELIPVMFIG